MNVIEELKGAHVVGITGHIRPDGDCTGSTLALYNYFKKIMQIIYGPLIPEKKYAGYGCFSIP